MRDLSTTPISTDQTFRSLFVGHGAPTLAMSHHASAGFLKELGASLPKPKAAIVISPHWPARGFAVKSAPRYSAWHDFGGFDDALYELRYAPAGDDALAQRVAAALGAAKLPTSRVEEARIDHGVWVPLMLMWPQAEVPVVQVAVAPGGGPQAHWALGDALRPFAEEGALVIGSGSAVHNLRDLSPDEDAPTFAWSQEFDRWIETRLLAGDREALIDYRRTAPLAAHAHPNEDHLLPLFTAAAAGGQARKLHESFTYGSLSMAAYGFA